MKLKTSVFILIASVVIAFVAIKVRNFLIGQKILGSLSLSSSSLKLKPMKKDIDTMNFRSGLSSSLYSINFIIPKTDTIKTFKSKEVYKSFLFNDSSKLKIIRDTLKIDFVNIFSEPSKEVGDRGVLGRHLKSNHINSDFDLLLHIYNETPDDIPFFTFSRDTIIAQYTLLKIKGVLESVGERKDFFYFKFKHLKGFQFGRPDLSKIVQVEIYTNHGSEYQFNFKNFSQKEIDAVISSVREI